MLTFKCQLTGGTNAALPRNIGQIFQEVKISSGSGQLLERYTDYDIYLRMEDDDEPADSFMGKKQILEGLYPVDIGVTCDHTDNPSNQLNAIQDCLGEGDDRVSRSANAHRYVIQIKTGIMQSQTLYPLSHASLRVELTIAPISRSCTTASGGTVATALTVSDVSMLLSNVKLDSKFVESFNSRYKEAGIPFYYQTVDTNSFNNLSSGTNRLKLSENISSLRAVKACQILTADLTNGTTESTKRTSGGLQDFQFLAGSDYTNSQVIICGSGSTTDEHDLEGGTEAFYEYCRVQCGLKGRDYRYPMISAKDWYGGNTTNVGGSKFVISALFNKSPEKDAVSGQKTKNLPLSMLLNYKSGVSNPADLSVFTFLYKDAVVTLSAIGDVVES